MISKARTLIATNLNGVTVDSFIQNMHNNMINYMNKILFADILNVSIFPVTAIDKDL